MTRYIMDNNCGSGEVRTEYIAYRIVEYREDGRWRFVEGHDGYDYATYRNAKKVADWMDSYNKKWNTRTRCEVKQVKVTVEVTQ